MAAKRVILAAMLATIAAAGPAGAAEDAPSPGFARQVLAELNRVRRDPAGYGAALARYRTYFRARLVVMPGEPRLMTDEGVAPVNEAIAMLARAPARRPLAEDGLLAAAAGDQVADQGGDGAVGHGGSDGSSPGDRVARRGGTSQVAEMIAYGARTPAEMIRQLVVDDGVPDRGHRTLLFAPNLAVAGVACGPHPVYDTMCVIDLAETPQGRRAWRIASR